MSFSLTLSECTGELRAIHYGEDATVSGISIDTRTIKPGELYVAIQGERFNGHDFITAAQDAGAAAVLVHEAVEASVPTLKVEDTQKALGDLARHWARRFQIPTVAITGSNGKTTVKEIVSTILQQLGPVLSTQGNLNNDIGVPLTLLRMRDEHKYAVVEMGASKKGDIARLVKIAKPDVALINNIGAAHLEGFGSIESIASAKSEIFSGLSADGYAVINADDEFASVMREAASHCHTRDFGLQTDVAVRGILGDRPEIHSLGKTMAPRLPFVGEHNFMNVLAAVAVVQCLDVPWHEVERGLEQVRPVPGRLERKDGLNQTQLIDDSYNANPDSTQSALKVLADCKGIRYLVLGDMAELGPAAEQLHSMIGEQAAKSGIDGLWTVGPLASNARKSFVKKHLKGSSVAGSHCVDQESLVNDLRDYLKPDVTFLVKGSRSARMERVVKAVSARSTTSASSAIAGKSQ